MDDQPGVRNSICRLLGSHSVDTVPAESGAEALRLIDIEPFDAVLLDQQMPGISGLETYRQLRSAGNEVAVYFMTGFAASRELEAVTRLDPQAKLIRKPFGLSELKSLFQESSEV